MTTCGVAGVGRHADDTAINLLTTNIGFRWIIALVERENNSAKNTFISRRDGNRAVAEFTANLGTAEVIRNHDATREFALVRTHLNGDVTHPTADVITDWLMTLARIAHAIIVGVELVGVVDVRTVIARITVPIAVGIQLIRVWIEDAVVFVIANAIIVGIDTTTTSGTRQNENCIGLR